jgi:hypothetical protein
MTQNDQVCHNEEEFPCRCGQEDRTVKEAWEAMIGEDRQLVTNELVEFEKEQVEVQDCMTITDHFKRNL